MDHSAFEHCSGSLPGFEVCRLKYWKFPDNSQPVELQRSACYALSGIRLKQGKFPGQTKPLADWYVVRFPKLQPLADCYVVQFLQNVALPGPLKSKFKTKGKPQSFLPVEKVEFRCGSLGYAQPEASAVALVPGVAFLVLRPYPSYVITPEDSQLEG